LTILIIIRGHPSDWFNLVVFDIDAHLRGGDGWEFSKKFVKKCNIVKHKILLKNRVDPPIILGKFRVPSGLSP
jgi:hypothetical protein